MVKRYVIILASLVATPAFGQSHACEENFGIEVQMFGYTSANTNEDLPGVARETALQRLREGLVAKGMTLNGAFEEEGLLYFKRKASLAGQQVELDVNVRVSSLVGGAGSWVKVTQPLPNPALFNEEALKREMCSVIEIARNR